MRRALLFGLLLIISAPGLLPAQGLIEIQDIQTRITERNNVYVQMAWRLTLANRAGRPVVVAAEIDFQDADGFIITSDYEGRLTLDNNEVKTFTGVHLIRTESIGKVSKVNVKTRIRP